VGIAAIEKVGDDAFEVEVIWRLPAIEREVDLALRTEDSLIDGRFTCSIAVEYIC
jgi:hypothetical protein